MSDRGIWIPYSKDETVVVLPKKGVEKLAKMFSDYCGWQVSERDAIQVSGFLIELQLMGNDAVRLRKDEKDA